MKWFANLKTRTKLAAGFGLIVCFMAIVAVLAFTGIQSMERHFVLAEGLMAVDSNLNSQRASLLTLLSDPDRSTWDRLIETIAATTRESDVLLAKLRQAGGTDSALQARIDELASMRDAFSTVRDGRVLPLAQQGDLAAARSIALGAQAHAFLEIRAFAQSLADDARARARARATALRTTVLTVGLAALLAAVLIVALLTRMIARPLGEITHVAARVAAGDLTVTLPAGQRTDEVGVLIQTFSRMTAALGAMAVVARTIAEADLRVDVQPQSDADVLGNAFATMVHNLRELMRSLAESTDVLAAATSEISVSTSQLASSASQTATAVGETTTTVAEVRQTAQVASDKAKTVSNTAQKVAQISQDGRQATDDMIEGMSRIREQMESIAQSMVRLSEQSQAVGQIVATVEDLAAQSNLLAVNASIEATRAGEHGKGFAVVAQEVKSLAGESKQATARVRAILGEIQKATGAAVMATEQGSKAVEAGVVQSTLAGRSIQTLVEGMTEAAHAAAQIAASSQQQLAGVDQVASAMTSINQAGAQNVDSARQMEAAAQNLKALGQGLKQLIERYRV